MIAPLSILIRIPSKYLPIYRAAFKPSLDEMGKTTEKMHLRGFFCEKIMKILKIGERDRRDMLKTMLISTQYFCILILEFTINILTYSVTLNIRRKDKI